jgi:hypothetical protein
VPGSYRNTHHNTGVIPEVETTSWTDGREKPAKVKKVRRRNEDVTENSLDL